MQYIGPKLQKKFKFLTDLRHENNLLIINREFTFFIFEKRINRPLILTLRKGNIKL